MIQMISGATMPARKAAPLATTLVGSARCALSNHLYTACTATGKAGPSAAPRITRLLSNMGKLEIMLIGNNATDQTTPMIHMIDLVVKRLGRKPTGTPEAKNNKKNALPSMP